MYELYNGSERLMSAIEHTMYDATFKCELAALLYYNPEQMVQDIKALRDRLDQCRRNEFKVG